MKRFRVRQALKDCDPPNVDGGKITARYKSSRRKYRPWVFFKYKLKCALDFVVPYQPVIDIGKLVQLNTDRAPRRAASACPRTGMQAATTWSHSRKSITGGRPHQKAFAVGLPPGFRGTLHLSMT